MKCKRCGVEVIRIRAMGGTVVCWASPTAYWPVRDEHARGLYTPNGISINGNLTGDPRKDHEPDICTKQGNAFDGEPCDPVEGDFDFIPYRDTW